MKLACGSFRTSDLEAEMLMNLNKKAWSEGLKTGNFIDQDKVRLA